MASIAVDPEGRIYLAEQVSGAVLVLDRQPGGDSYEISIFTAGDTLSVTVQDEITEELEDGITRMPTTVMAQAEGDFQVNALVLGEGGYGLDGFDVYYLSQLGEEFDGDGSIIRIRIKRDDPNTVLIDKFFEPDETQLELNPSALVFDESAGGVFGNKMYLGTFGASLGDDFDGSVYVVDENGVISSFVTGFVDRDGQPVVMGGNVVDGFFDVTDMAFSPSMAGPYGEYLYVLSENIDENGEEPDTGCCRKRCGQNDWENFPCIG